MKNHYRSLLSVTLSLAASTALASGGVELVQIGSNANNRANAGAIQSDGGILSVGLVGSTASSTAHSAALRMTPAGEIDSSFGSGGSDVISVSSTGDGALACLLQADGKLVSAGSVTRKSHTSLQGGFSLLRFNSDGSLDSSFKNGRVDGEVAAYYGSGNSAAYAVGQLSDGSLVAAGNTTSAASSWLLGRFSSSGSQMTSFGSSGWAVHAFGGGSPIARAVAVSGSDQILVAGNAYNPASGSDDFTVLRYTSDGALDGSFGNAGVVQTDISGADESYAMALQSDGKILLAGRSHNPTQWTVARYNSDGSLDSGFGLGGVALFDMNGGAATGTVYGVQELADGRIAVAGLYFDKASGTNQVGVAQLNPDGSVDSTFNGGQIAHVAVLASVSVQAMQLQADGKPVVFGYSGNGSVTYMMAVRFNQDGSLDSSF